WRRRTSPLPCWCTRASRRLRRGRVAPRDLQDPRAHGLTHKHAHGLPTGSINGMSTTPAGPVPGRDVPLRIALTSYRSKPHSGGQGIYDRQLARALTDLGHDVGVSSGQPYPDLSGLDALEDGSLRLTEVPRLDLYHDADPFRTPGLREFRNPTDVLEYAT